MSIITPLQSLKYDFNSEPYAQVTVIDSAEGDANLIDVRLPTGLWRRVLIDTGPVNKTIKILENCQAALSSVTCPQQDGYKGNDFVLPLNEFQVTHIDLDHIGNAADLANGKILSDLLEQWHTANKAYKCLFVFPHVPPHVPRLEWVDLLAHPIYHQIGNESYNQLILRLPASVLNWGRDMVMFGFRPEIRLTILPTFPGLLWEDAGEIRDPIGMVSNALCCTYTHEFFLEGHQVPVTLELHIYDTDGKNGEILAHKTNEDTTINFDAFAWVNPAAVPFNGPRILHVTDAILPVPLLPPTLDTRKVDYRGSEVAWARPLRRLGTAVSRLRRRGLAETQNALNTMYYHTNFMGQDTAFQYYRNPHLDAYRAFGRFVLVDDYANENYGDNVDVDKIATNRSSTVTLFHHPGLALKMLFTADAYDRNCDIRRTMFEYNTTETQKIEVHILKLPHHGSEVTVDSTFYEVVQAEVYLVCGDHHNISENPRFSTLVAIVKSFRNRKRDSGQPFRMYFSSSRILNSDGHASAVAALITSVWGPKMVNNVWDYELYRNIKSFGSILFSARKPLNPNKPVLVDERALDRWTICHVWNPSSGKAVVQIQP